LIYPRPTAEAPIDESLLATLPNNFVRQEISNYTLPSSFHAGMTCRRPACARTAPMRTLARRLHSQKVAAGEVPKTTHFQRFSHALTKSCVAP